MDKISNDITPNVKKIDRYQLLKMSGWMIEHLHDRLSRAKFVEITVLPGVSAGSADA